MPTTTCCAAKKSTTMRISPDSGAPNNSNLQVVCAIAQANACTRTHELLKSLQKKDSLNVPSLKRELQRIIIAITRGRDGRVDGMKNSAGTKQTKTSRTEAGPKALLQAKNRGQQGGQITINEEYRQRIKVLSEGSEIENYDFRAGLKNYVPDDIDDVVKALSQKYFALIDCKECANRCRVLELEFTEPELHTIARSMEHSIDEFKKRFVVKGIMKPCTALKGNLYSIYEGRQTLAGHILTLKNRISLRDSTESLTALLSAPLHSTLLKN